MKVALCELAEDGGDVLRAAERHIERRLRTAKADVGVPREHGGHDGIRTAAVCEFDFDAFLFEIAQRIGEIHGRVEDGMRDFVDADGLEAVVFFSASGEREEGEDRRSEHCK